MSVLGYSELLKEIYGVSPKSLQHEISILLKAKPSKQRIALLRMLANGKKSTVSELLRKCKMNNTGGSFRVIRKFFDELVSLGILKKENIGRRAYYLFPENSDLGKWLSN